MDRVRKGEQPWTTLDNLHRASLDKLVKDFGITGLTEADLAHINRGWHRLNGWPDSVPGLTRLKRRFIIGPLSNGNVGLLTKMAKHAGLPWDMVFGSDLFGHFKPDGDVSGRCEAAEHQARRGDDSGGPRRSGKRAEAGTDDGVLRASRRIRPAPEARLCSRSGLGCGGEGHRGSGDPTRRLIPPSVHAVMSSCRQQGGKQCHPI
jgi:hypothetical protein